MEQQSCPAGHSGCKHERAEGVCDHCGFDFEAEHLTAESLEVAKQEARAQFLRREAQATHEHVVADLRVRLQEKEEQAEQCAAELSRMRSDQGTVEASLSEAQSKLEIALKLGQEKNEEIERQKALVRKEAGINRSLGQERDDAKKEAAGLREENERLQSTAGKSGSRCKKTVMLLAVAGVFGGFVAYQAGEEEGLHSGLLAGRQQETAELTKAKQRVADLERQLVEGKQNSASGARNMPARVAPSPKISHTRYRDLEVFRDLLKGGVEGPDLVALPGSQMAMGRTEVTVGQYFACVKAGWCKEPEWREVGNKTHYQIGSNDHYKKLGVALTGDNYPIVGVSWKDAEAYVKWLTNQTGKAYRLPREDEWERACRAGQQHEYCGSDDIDRVAWSSNNSGGKTHPVGQKQANAWGLVDMSGNVWEWTDSCVDDDCGRRVLRGGSWFSSSVNARVASRGRLDAMNRSDSGGFRVARMLP